MLRALIVVYLVWIISWGCIKSKLLFKTMMLIKDENKRKIITHCMYKFLLGIIWICAFTTVILIYAMIWKRFY